MNRMLVANSFVFASPRLPPTNKYIIDGSLYILLHGEWPQIFQHSIKIALQIIAAHLKAFRHIHLRTHTHTHPHTQSAINAFLW